MTVGTIMVWEGLWREEKQQIEEDSVRIGDDSYRRQG